VEGAGKRSADLGGSQRWAALGDSGGGEPAAEQHQFAVLCAVHVQRLMLMSLQVENKVVAVDLSAWLMQAQSQPALLEHYDSPYARAAKVVFDRVSRRCSR
jgi:hypothetical protein